MHPESVPSYNPPNPSDGNSSFGVNRRKIIRDWFVANPNGRLYINCKYRPQLKDDSDLQYLVSKGFLVKVREHCGFFNSNHKITYLIAKTQQ